MDADKLNQAIRTFESEFNCHLSFHDYTGRMAVNSVPEEHFNFFCSGYKKHYNGDKKCIWFDTAAIRRELFSGKFFLKCCHYGLWEGVFPVLVDNTLAAAFFAGPFGGVNGSISADIPVVKADVCCKKLYFDRDLPLLPENISLFQSLGEMIAESTVAVYMKKENCFADEKSMIKYFIEHNFKRNIGLDDLAAVLNITPARASAKVKRLFGCGFTSMLNHQRIATAKHLLRNTGFSVVRIAGMCGFNDSSYFHRIFRRCCGVSPVGFRQGGEVETIKKTP